MVKRIKIYVLSSLHPKSTGAQGKTLGVFETYSTNQPFQPGDRVRLRALKDFGTVRLLHGLAGEIVGPHPIARGWFKVRLDPNDITPDLEWSVPGDRLVREGDANQGQGTSQRGKTVRHYP
jgi:hypothetical protein